MIRRDRTDRNPCQRPAIAAVEMAVLLPLMLFLFVIGADFARLFYATTTIANCSRAGAMWDADPYVRADSRHKTLADAALADASNLIAKDPSNPPTVSKLEGSDSNNRPFTTVTVTYQFRMFVDYPGIPARFTVSRSTRMFKAPPNPT